MENQMEKMENEMETRVIQEFKELKLHPYLGGSGGLRR